MQSPKFGKTFEVTGVPDRSNILFHWGNYPDDTEGCIILGATSPLGTVPGVVLGSKSAFQEFMEALKSENGFYLQIEGGNWQSLLEKSEEN